MATGTEKIYLCGHRYQDDLYYRRDRYRDSDPYYRDDRYRDDRYWDDRCVENWPGHLNNSWRVLLFVCNNKLTGTGTGTGIDMKIHIGMEVTGGALVIGR